MFFLTVILPSLVLVSLTLRIIKQDQELSQKRAAEEHRRLVEVVRKHFLEHLENIKLQESNTYIHDDQTTLTHQYQSPEVIFLGRVVENMLILPWESLPELSRSRELLTTGHFSQRIREAERTEFVSKDYESSIQIYRQCIGSFTAAAQKQYAQLQLSRALGNAGKHSESLAEYRTLLMSEPSALDEFGIPFSLYAGKALVAHKGQNEAVVKRIDRDLEGRGWFTPIAAYFLRDLLSSLAQVQLTEPLRAKVDQAIALNDGYINTMESAAELQADFPSLGFSLRQRSQSTSYKPLWLAYGDDPWLISMSPSFEGRESVLFVLDGQNTFLTFKSKKSDSESIPSRFHFISGMRELGESLGAGFQNLRIVFEPGLDDHLAKQSSLPGYLYFLLLIFVLGITFFGGYLLWRDVRREVRMAELRSQFVSSVSHELKTPLTAIRMFAETLRLGRSKNAQAQEDYLDTIVNESQRLTRLLNNVLDFSKIEKGKRTYHKELASLADVTQAAADTMAYPLSQQGFALNVKIENDFPDVFIDRDAIEQAILNLLSNAMKYSGDAKEIELHLIRRDNSGIIQVIDRGVGIPFEEQKNIFNRFYRIPNPINERSAGTGLGLSLVAHIVDSHGGEVKVESSLGEGSTFSIYLPLENEE